MDAHAGNSSAYVPSEARWAALFSQQAWDNERKVEALSLSKRLGVCSGALAYRGRPWVQGG